jgi:uncharacterized protein YggU (UPF0235/DUF167 family)
VEKRSEDNYIIAVCEKAERNQANIRIIKIVASIFHVSIKNIRIINGHHNQSKILSVNLPNEKI